MSIRHRRFHLDSVDSTSSEASRLAAMGEAPPFWVTADRQIKGRGRRGQPWASVTGNLYASFLIEHEPSPLIGQLPLVAAVSLHDAIEALKSNRDLSVHSVAAIHPVIDITIKWPNDVMVNGLKVAGILVESEIVGDRARLVLGFGVNCAHHPEHSRHPATDLRDQGLNVGPADIFEALSQSLQKRLSEWEWGNGFESIRQSWLARAAGLNERILVRLPKETLEGRFDDLDQAGHLVLVTEAGSQRVSAGDVFLLETGTLKDSNPQ